MKRVSKHVTMALVLYCILSLGGYRAIAQQAKPQERRDAASGVRVTVALVDAVPNAHAKAVILRRSRTEPHDVILLTRSGADGEQLSAAIMTVMVARQMSGDTAEVDAALAVAQRRGPQAWKATKAVYAQRIVDRLLQARPRAVAGVGMVPALDIVLPSAQSRAAQRSVQLMRR